MKVFHVYVETLIIAISLVYLSSKKSMVPFHLQSFGKWKRKYGGGKLGSFAKQTNWWIVIALLFTVSNPIQYPCIITITKKIAFH